MKGTVTPTVGSTFRQLGIHHRTEGLARPQTPRPDIAVSCRGEGTGGENPGNGRPLRRLPTVDHCENLAVDRLLNFMNIVMFSDKIHREITP